MIKNPCKECICLPTCIHKYKTRYKHICDIWHDEEYAPKGSVVNLCDDCKLLFYNIYDLNGMYIDKTGNIFNSIIDWWKDNYGE